MSYPQCAGVIDVKKIATTITLVVTIVSAGCATLSPTGPGSSAPHRTDVERAADLYSLGLIAFNSGNLEVSLDYMNQAMAVPGVDQQTYAKMRLLRAEIYTDLEKYDLARTEIAQIIADSPDSADAYFVSGLLSYKTGNMAAAVRDLTQALTLDPSFSRAENLLGNIAKERGDSEKALSWYNEAIAGDDTFAPAYFNRAEVDMALGHYDSAVSDYSSAISHYSELQTLYLAQAYCGRADAFLMTGNIDMSRRDREKAEGLSPGICAEEKQTGPRWGKGEIRPH
jgi:tetratricopeptide (TPR) repeat protein